MREDLTLKIEINEIQRYACWACEDYRQIDIFDQSTDGLIGTERCHRIHPVIWKRYRDINWKMSDKEKANLPPF